MNERDRGAVAVADEDGIGDAELRQHGRQRLQRLLMHVRDRPRRYQGVGTAVAKARIDQGWTARSRGESRREIAPERDRAQSLVQEHEGRSARLRPSDRLVFEAASLDGEDGHGWVLDFNPRESYP
jgi:hypothetical protein